MKIISFKCLSPFFELTRDGKKPFEIRLRDNRDARWRALNQWNPIICNQWAIELVHLSGETHKRLLLGIDRIYGRSETGSYPTDWVIMYLGHEIK